jgi:zinc and cadmium transporter
MIYVIFFSLVGGLFSLIGALILFKDKKQASKIVQYATPFAAGVLLAAAFTGLLPEALEQNDNFYSILLATLIAFLIFFFLERFLQVFHHHHEHEEKKKKSSSSLIIIGDTLHNALDGVAIGAAFLVSPATGIVAAIAVALHEIPQEIGDFGLLLKNGMKHKKVVLVNVISALATTITAVIVYGFGNSESSLIPYMLAITAGFFIYIAASDIVPELHEKSKSKYDLRPWFLLLGAVLIMIISPIAHEYIDAGHDDHSHSVSEKDDHHDEHDEEHQDEMHDDHTEEDHDDDHEEDKTTQ